MDLQACVDILKQRNITSHNDACPCLSRTESCDVGENKFIPEPEQLLSYGDGCFLEAITDLFALQQTRVKSYSEFQSQFDEIMDTMSAEEGGVNAGYVQQTFPLWCASMTDTFSKVSRRIIQIREYLQQQRLSAACSYGNSSSSISAQDTVLTGAVQSAAVATAAAASRVDKVVALISRLQGLEKEKFTVFASSCLDNFRLKSKALKEVNVDAASTTLMDVEQSMSHTNTQKAALEERISEELLELQELKAEFAEGS